MIIRQVLYHGRRDYNYIRCLSSIGYFAEGEKKNIIYYEYPRFLCKRIDDIISQYIMENMTSGAPNSKNMIDITII